MGGENCDDCSKCIRSEFALTKALGQTQANKVFGQVVLQKHIIGLLIDVSSAALVELVHTSRCGYAKEAQDQYSQAANRLVDD